MTGLTALELATVADWVATIDDYHANRDPDNPVKVHIDCAEVWVDGILAGYINIDGAGYVFVPSK